MDIATSDTLVRPVGVALLGVAHIHVHDLVRVVHAQPEVRVVAVWDRDLRRAERWAAVLGSDVCAHPDAALDREEVQGALVFSETSRHRALVSAAALRGMAVFVEKPLAVSLSDAVATTDALTGSQIFSTGFFLRYADAFRRLRDLVVAGEVGRVRRVTIRVVHDGLGRGWFDGVHAWMRDRGEGGGGFYDLVIHGLDLASWIFGPVTHVDDLRVRRSGHHGVAVVTTESGTTIDLEAGWEASAPAIEMSVTATAATLTAVGGLLVAGSRPIAEGRPPDAGDAPRAWFDALTDQPGQPLVSLDDAVDRVRVIDGLRRLEFTESR